MCSFALIGYFIFIGILILSYVLLHGKTYHKNKFNVGWFFFHQNEVIGIFYIQFVKMVHLFIFSTIATNPFWGLKILFYHAYRQGLSNITKYNITYLSRKELNSCWNLLVKFFEGNSLECNSFVILKPSSMNFPKRMSCWSTADWTDNWWWRVSIILLLMLISCRIFDVNILKFGASTEMRFYKYIDSCRVFGDITHI